MPLVFYKSALCPRCHAAGRTLSKLAAADPSLSIEEVDILSSPLRAWRDGVRMIPALKDGDRLLSGIFLGEAAIRLFLDESRRR